MKKKGRKKVKKIKKIFAPKVQTIFCVISFLFIVGCCAYYGNRLVKYYKIYNPKSETGETLLTLSNSIETNSTLVFDGDGLYNESEGNYTYKGSDVNNYIIVNNKLFRIIKINSDGTIDIVLDDFINKMEWNKEITKFDDSSISKFLNEEFFKSLDENLFVKTKVCTDVIHEISELSCNESTSNNYVRLLGIYDFYNSMNDDSNTYLIKNNEFLWLYNHGVNNAWNTSGETLANSSPTKSYGVKPVLTLKNSVVLLNGDGSKENPYMIEKNDKTIRVGTTLDINDNIFTVYEVGEDYYKLESNRLISGQIFDKNTNVYENSSIKKYLEDTYVKSLNIDKLLKETTWGNIKSNVGMLSQKDIKFDDSLKSYYLIDTMDSDVLLYNSTLSSSKVYVKRGVRPCISISKDIKISSGWGNKLSPYIVEV